LYIHVIVYRGKLLLEVRMMSEREKQEINDEDTEQQETVKDTETEETVEEQDVVEEAEEIEIITDESHTENEHEILKTEVDQLNERLLRVQAEYENYRKRTEKERIAARKYEAESLATELLQVIDNFERALQTEVDDNNKGFFEG